MKTLTKEQAQALLSTFNNPCKDEVSSSPIAYNGKFNSNSDYMDKPVVFGGYVKSDGDLVEITIGWTDIPGMDDETNAMLHGYSFQAENVRNWAQAAQATREHLNQIVKEQ